MNTVTGAESETGEGNKPAPKFNEDPPAHGCFLTVIVFNFVSMPLTCVYIALQFAKRFHTLYHI